MDPHAALAPDFFSVSNGLALSSIGLGTYLGDSDTETDRAVADAAIALALGGCNVFETAQLPGRPGGMLRRRGSGRTAKS
jgi:aryl-alcohol dehydrogenase-like predicted oxidoreductase